MQGAEGSSHQFAVATILVQRQQRRFQFDEDLASFFLKGLLVLINHALFENTHVAGLLRIPLFCIHGRRKLLQACIRRGCQNLLRQPSCKGESPA